MFWRRRGSEPEGEAEEAAARDALAPVRVYTTNATIDGWIDLQGQRLSDLLNVEDLLSVSRVDSAPNDDHWFVIDRADMLIVVPPPHVSDRLARLHRVKRRIVVQIGHYSVRGLVHMIAGIGLDPFLARSRQHFLPVTDASVTSAERTELEERYPALLVNVRNTAEQLRLEVLE